MSHAQGKPFLCHRQTLFKCSSRRYSILTILFNFTYPGWSQFLLNANRKEKRMSVLLLFRGISKRVPMSSCLSLTFERMVLYLHFSIFSSVLSLSFFLSLSLFLECNIAIKANGLSTDSIRSPPFRNQLKMNGSEISKHQEKCL